MRIDAAQVHAQVNWPVVLEQAGIDSKYLRNRHGPCPACGGKDRFRFDNKGGKGAYFCSGCGPGDGFTLLMRTFGMSFADAIQRVCQIVGIQQAEPVQMPVREPEAEEVARPTRRVLNLLRETCPVEDCQPVAAYLASRGLWPLPAGHSLRAHPSVEYFHERQSVGRFPALVATVTDLEGDRVTAHVTYLEQMGAKLSGFEPRKILSGMTGRKGCAVRLVAAGPVLGIAEGIETALSASRIHGTPTWAALNTSLLQKFVPPAGVERLVIYADRDVAGLNAAAKLGEELQGRVTYTIRTPDAKDWNDVWRQQ